MQKGGDSHVFTCRTVFGQILGGGVEGWEEDQPWYT
jgi:hypothetical protein